MDTDLTKAIAGLIEAGRQTLRAFGAPGDWGCSSKEGEALFALARALRAVVISRGERLS